MVFSNAKVNPVCKWEINSPLMQDARRSAEESEMQTTFTSMYMVLISRSIDIAVRMRVLKCYVWESLCLNVKLEALETWFYRRRLTISWKDRITNEELYRRMNTHKSLLIEIVQMQLSFL